MWTFFKPTLHFKRDLTKHGSQCDSVVSAVASQTLWRASFLRRVVSSYTPKTFMLGELEMLTGPSCDIMSVFSGLAACPGCFFTFCPVNTGIVSWFMMVSVL